MGQGARNRSPPCLPPLVPFALVNHTIITTITEPFAFVYHPRTSLTGSRTRQSLVFPYADQSLATSATCGKVSILVAGGIA